MPFAPMICCRISPPAFIADNQSIRFRLVHEIGVDDAAGAGHVFNYDRRIAGNVFAQMAPIARE